MSFVQQGYSEPAGFKTNTCMEGYTLLELLLVLAIFSLTIVLAAPYVSGGLSNTMLKTTAKKTAAALNYARNMSVRERRNYYVEAQKDRIVVSGKDGAQRKEISIPAELSMTAAGNHVIVFYPRGGSNGGVFELGETDGKPLYAIQVEPATGAVTVSAL